MDPAQQTYRVPEYILTWYLTLNTPTYRQLHHSCTDNCFKKITSKTTTLAAIQQNGRLSADYVFTFTEITAKKNTCSQDVIKQTAYNEKLGKYNVTKFNVGKGFRQRCSAESWDEWMQCHVTVDNVGVVVCRQQWQQTHQTRHVRLTGDWHNIMSEQCWGHGVTSPNSTSTDTLW